MKAPIEIDSRKREWSHRYRHSAKGRAKYLEWRNSESYKIWYESRRKPFELRSERFKAKSLGKKFFFTGKSCKYGHLCERRTSDGVCLECEIIRRKRMYDKHKVRYLAQTRIWKHANKEHIKSYRQKYFKENPEVKRRSQSKRRALKLGGGGSHTTAELNSLLLKQTGKCASCFGGLGKKYHRDHIQPLALGGSDFIENIQLLCVSCNVRKGMKDPVVWAQEMGRLL